MSIELVKALLEIVRACTTQDNCEECPLKDFCGKTFQSF
jgi:endonuclease III